MKVTFTVPLEGQYPCQAEGYLEVSEGDNCPAPEERAFDKKEFFYFKQRGTLATLKIFDSPLGETLDQGKTPSELAKYTLDVPPLAGDATMYMTEVLETFNELVEMHVKSKN